MDGKGGLGCPGTLEQRLGALSPLDGRYADRLVPYAEIFSEAGLIKQRFAVEVAWLEFLSHLPQLGELGELSSRDSQALKRWAEEIGLAEAAEVKRLESLTNHDVKAVEYFLKQKLVSELGWSEARAEFAHFGATSEDVNNLAYARMTRTALHQAWLPAAESLVDEVRELAVELADTPMLARTHGQPATPTTLGKELAVFVARWERQLRNLRAIEIPGKWGGATGTLAAHVAAYPELDWAKVAEDFVRSLGFQWAPLTTQVEPGDWVAELLGAMNRFGTVLVDFCQDMWLYISLGYFRQKLVEGEVGSSTMPHKVNPIDFENGEGNAGVANALFAHLSAKLPVSRLQRDLSGSSVLRNIGSAFGYSALAISSVRRGLGRVAADPVALARDLERSWEVLSEAAQTVMRRYGVAGAYEQLKSLSRGRELTREDFRAFVAGLEVPEEAKQRLLALTPATYTGLAARLARLARPSAGSSL